MLNRRRVRPEGTLAQSAARGAAVTLAGRMTRLAIQLGSVVALSRVLSPADFGLVAMVVAVIGIGELLREFGLGSAAIQAKILTNQQRDNLFWVSSGLGLLVGLLAAASAPLLVRLYDEPRLLAVTLVLSVTFLLTGMTSQYRANLARDLRFGALQTTDLVPAALGVLIAFVLALLGFGYWALVAQQIVQSALGLGMAAALGSWLPHLPRRTPGMGAFYRYGVNLFLSQLLGYATKNVHSVVIGARFGAAPLGLYNRAYELVVHPINQLNMPSTKVAVPVLSKLQDDWDRYVAFLLKGQRVMLHLTFPLIALGGALASPLVLIALGPQWQGSATIMQILVIAVAGDSFAYAMTWFALSRAETSIELRVNLVSAPLRIAAVIVGASWGVIGVAVGFAIGQWLHTLIAYVWFRVAANAPSRQLATAGLRALLTNLPAAGAAFAASSALSTHNEWIQLAAGFGAFAAAWCIVVVAVPPIRRDILDAVSIARYLRGRRAG